MKRKKYLYLIICMLLLIIAISAYKMLEVGNREEKKQISVIVDNSNDLRWSAFKEGLKQGEIETDSQVNLVSTEKLYSWREEKKLIQREIENGSKAIILEVTEDSNVADYFEELSKNIKIVLLNSNIYAQREYTLVTPDNEKIGKILGEEILKEEAKKATSKKLRVGVFCGNEKQDGMAKRLQSFMKVLGEKEIKPVWVIYNRRENSYLSLENKLSKEQVDVLVCLGNVETELAVDELEKQKTIESKLYGVGCSEKLIYHLDKGNIEKLLAPNEFRLGYQSVVSAKKMMDYYLQKDSTGFIDFTLVDKDSVYDKENQKVLFPIVQ
ncbi:MAG TPA: substrate-binding domain-containing protein [Lachnospiraceae bacterium]